MKLLPKQKEHSHQRIQKNPSHGKQKAFLVDIRLKALGNIYVLAISPLSKNKKKKKNLRQMNTIKVMAK